MDTTGRLGMCAPHNSDLSVDGTRKRKERYEGEIFERGTRSKVYISCVFSTLQFDAVELII